MAENTSGNHDSETPGSFEVRILRQDRPRSMSYWERHRLWREPHLNLTAVLQRIAAQATTVEGKKVAPVAYDSNCLEEVCGSCTMVINGRVRMACSSLVDKLLEENAPEIELRPMEKFPVVRDLVVDRRRLFGALEKVKAWMPVDGYYDMGPGPRQSPEEQQQAYPLSKCISCGCCLDACPQYGKVELVRLAGESDEQLALRQQVAFDRSFIGAHAMNQVVLYNSHPTGRLNAAERVEAVTSEGGIQDCGKAENCMAVCPKEIPLMESWARAGRAATWYKLKKCFDR